MVKYLLIKLQLITHTYTSTVPNGAGLSFHEHVEANSPYYEGLTYVAFPPPSIDVVIPTVTMIIISVANDKSRLIDCMFQLRRKNLSNYEKVIMQ